MTIVKYIGLFLLLTGVCLISVKKKQKKGEETWEGNHGIIVKTWMIVLPIIIGFILVFASNFHANITFTDANGNKTVIKEWGEQSEETEIEYNTEDIIDTESDISENVSNTEVIENTEYYTISINEQNVHISVNKMNMKTSFMKTIC